MALETTAGASRSYLIVRISGVASHSSQDRTLHRLWDLMRVDVPSLVPHTRLAFAGVAHVV